MLFKKKKKDSGLADEGDDVKSSELFQNSTSSPPQLLQGGEQSFSKKEKVNGECSVRSQRRPGRFRLRRIKEKFFTLPRAKESGLGMGKTKVSVAHRGKKKIAMRTLAK